MGNQTAEKSLRERWETNLISDKLIVELFWRKKNGTLPKPTTFLERMLDKWKR